MQGSPLEQFSVYKVELLGYSLSLHFTNFLFFAAIILIAAGILFVYGSFNYKVVPDRWAGFVETYYFYVYNLIKENAGARAQIFFPFLATVFFFILISNLLGMFPFGYALTSQVLITFLFSCSIFLGTIFLGLRRHGINFFSLFFPSGSPAFMAFLLVPIELLSFIARPFSLGIRLFANMLAGHVLLKILSTFILIGVFAVQGLDVSAISLFFKQSWITEKFGSTQLSKHTYVGVDQPALGELTRVYLQPKVFDFSDTVDRASAVENKPKMGFDLSGASNEINKVSPVDENVRIGKDMLKKVETNITAYQNHLNSATKKTEVDCTIMDTPQAKIALGMIWKNQPSLWEIHCIPEGPSASFWRWFLYGGFEPRKPMEFSSIDDPNLWKYLEIMFKCAPCEDPSSKGPFIKMPKEMPVNPGLGEQTKVPLGKHFPFIYSLPPSSESFLFSFNISFLALFNFFLSPALLVAKAAVIVAQVALLLAFVMLELGIAFLQAYVFIILTSIYINDSLQLH